MQMSRRPLSKKRLGYIYNPHSMKEGMEASRQMTDKLGSRQRDLSTSSVTKRANGLWHAVIHIQLPLITA